MTAQQFYKANATNVVNVPNYRQGSVVNHTKQPGWAGVRQASEARFIAKDCLVMTLSDAFDFAEKYHANRKGLSAEQVKNARERQR